MRNYGCGLSRGARLLVTGLGFVVSLAGLAGLMAPPRAQAGCWGIPPFIFCSLDKQGQGGSCKRKCKVTAITSTPASHKKGIYSFLGACWYQRSGTAACPPNPGPDSMRIKASWNERTHVAAEAVSFKAWGKSGNTYVHLFTTYSRCGVNPWASKYHGCRLVKRIGKNALTDKTPFTALSISNRQRNWLRGDFMRGLVPNIKLPKSGQSFSKGKAVFQAQVGIPSEARTSHGNHTLTVEFRHLVWPGRPSHGVVRTFRNVPNSNFVLFSQKLKPGDWTVRARLSLPKPGGPWSSPVRFKVR